MRGYQEWAYASPKRPSSITEAIGTIHIFLFPMETLRCPFEHMLIRCLMGRLPRTTVLADFWLLWMVSYPEASSQKQPQKADLPVVGERNGFRPEGSH